MRRAAGRALMGSFARNGAVAVPTATMNQAFNGQGTVGSVASTTMTTTLTAATGEVVVIKCLSWKGTVIFGTPTATGMTFTRTVPATSASSASPSATIWTSVIPAGLGGSAVTITHPVQNQSSGTGYFTLCIERWTGQLTTNYGTLNAGTTSPFQATLTPASLYSGITWGLIDSNYVTPSAPVYVGAPTTDFAPYQVAAAYTSYAGYQVPTSLGANAFGLTAPNGMKAALAGLEILAPAA